MAADLTHTHGHLQDVDQQHVVARLSAIFDQQIASMHQAIQESQSHATTLLLGLQLQKENEELHGFADFRSRDLSGVSPDTTEFESILPGVPISAHEGHVLFNRPQSRNKVAWDNQGGIDPPHVRCNGDAHAVHPPHDELEMLETLDKSSDSRISCGRTSAVRFSTNLRSDPANPDDTQELIVNSLDPDALKDTVRKSLSKRTYKASDSYKSEGTCQWIARHPIFEQATLALVAVNALWIWIDTDFNKAALLADSHAIFIVAESIFCVFFLFEWLIRLLALEEKCHAFKDSWFLFETVLVATMVMETVMLPLIMLVASESVNGGKVGNLSVLRVGRLMRLTRMARIARLLRAMPELLIVVKALKAAMRSVFFTLFLLLIVLYVFGIAFAQLTHETPIGDEMFTNVATSMYTLLLFGVLSLDYLEDISAKLSDVGAALSVLLFMFVLLAALTIMNMLIGVLCEVVSAVAKVEKETLLVNYAKGKVEKIVEELDTDGDRLISKNELSKILSNQAACKALHDVGVDVLGLIDLADVMFWDNVQQVEVKLSFSQFMDVVLNLRDTNVATVKDILSLGRVVRSAVEKVDAHLTQMLAVLPDTIANGQQISERSVSFGTKPPSMNHLFLPACVLK